MPTDPPNADPPAPDRDAVDDRPGRSPEELVASARKQARGAWRLTKVVAKPFVPKKWDARSIGISVALVVLVVLLVQFVFNWIVSFIVPAVLVALVLGGLYLALGPRR